MDSALFESIFSLIIPRIALNSLELEKFRVYTAARFIYVTFHSNQAYDLQPIRTAASRSLKASGETSDCVNWHETPDRGKTT